MVARAMTQTDRLIRFLRDHPGASSLELTLALGIVNVTGRVSDARAEGHVIECKRRADKRQGYTLVEKPVQLALDVA
jgi:hypothetical protein